MSLDSELKEKVSQIFRDGWTERSGKVVPSPDDIKLTNDAVKLTGVVLYADMSDSTKLVDSYINELHFPAEIYKAYLHCCAKIIISEGGEIAAYDGDRIMAIFIGDSKETFAVKAALKINYARIHIINPAIKTYYSSSTDFQLNHTVGIDTSELFVANTGIRGSKDLVWVGRAANHAAKLCSLTYTYKTRITKAVYNNLPSNLKFSHEKPMWVQSRWNETQRSVFLSAYCLRIK